MRSSSLRLDCGWSRPQRVLLAILAAIAAIGLGLSSRATEGPTRPAPALVVDPNTAPAPVLGALPRLGPKLVRGIVLARENRPFRSLGDLDGRVKRIGPATIGSLRPFLRFEPIAAPADRDQTPRTP